MKSKGLQHQVGKIKGLEHLSLRQRLNFFRFRTSSWFLILTIPDCSFRRYVICPTSIFPTIICPTERGKLQLSYTSIVLHIICPTPHLSYISFVLHIICPTYHLSYIEEITSFVLHFNCTPHYLFYRQGIKCVLL